MKRRRATSFDLYLQERLKEPEFERVYRLELAKISALQVRLRAARTVAQAKWSKGAMRDAAVQLRDQLKLEVEQLEREFMESQK